MVCCRPSCICTNDVGKFMYRNLAGFVVEKNVTLNKYPY